MADIFGFTVPTIDITGYLSSTWIYVAAVGVIGFFMVVLLGLVLFFTTYKRKVEFYEDIAGRGFQRVAIRRARIIKAGEGDVEILKPLGVSPLTAYGRKIQKNTYMFVKGPDGLWYNSTYGDLDTESGILDIEPVERDVRMFRVAIDRLTRKDYEKKSFLEKHGTMILGIIFLLIMIGGMWFIVSKIGDATGALAKTADTNVQVLEALGGVAQKADNIKSGTGGSSGLIQDVTGGG